MSEENLPPIPEQVQVPQEQQTSIVWGVLAIVGSLFCWVVGLILSIIGLCKYRKGSTGRVLSWIGLAIFVIVTAFSVLAVCMTMETTEEMMEAIKRDHPEFTNQQLMEYIQNPDNKAEVEKYMKEGMYSWLDI